MPSTAFAFANGSFQLSGRWSTTTDSGHPCKLQTSEDGALDFNFTGTACTMLARLVNACEVSVDGAAYTSLGAVAWGNVTLATGLSDALHTITVRAAATVNSLYLDTTTIVTVTGASPAVSTPVNWGTIVLVQSAAFTSVGQSEGVGGNWNFGGHTSPNARVQSRDGRLRLPAVAGLTDVWAWTYNQAGKFALDLDDVYHSTTSLPVLTRYGWVRLATGLSTSAVTRVGITAVNPAQVVIDAFRLGGTTADATALPSRRIIGAIGDSITEGSNTGDADCSKSWFYKLILARKRNGWNKGISGNFTAQVKARITDMTGIAGIKDAILFVGTNDVGITAVPTFKTDYKDCITAILAVSGLQKLLCSAITPRTTGTIGPYNTAIQEAVSEAADARCIYVPAPPTFNIGTDLFDTVHPNEAGSIKLANNFATFLDDSLQSISGASGSYFFSR